MKTLFLNPPSFQGFDGGAGSRYQAKREIKSFWYPTWLAQVSALIPGSRLIDAPAHGLAPRDIVEKIGEYELAVLYTSTPSFENDARLALRLKHRNHDLKIGMVGPHVTVLAEESLRDASAVDFAARGEFDYTIRRLANGEPIDTIAGISYKDGDIIRHNPDAGFIEELDKLPFVVDVYKRDLNIENYFIGYLLHPYISIYTGRGCPARCTFCLWPQTMTGHVYRVRSVENVLEEMAKAVELFPGVKEFFFDDDTFTANRKRAVEMAKGLGKMGIVWSTSSRAHLDIETLKTLKDNGLRLLMVGFESGNDSILKRVKKGINTDTSRRFMKYCKDLGIRVHGTFMLGLPGETPETIAQTIRFAKEIDPDTIQVSIAAPYPGTRLYEEAVENGWSAHNDMVASDGTQICALDYPDLKSEQVLPAVERFYKSFYFRPKVIARIVAEMSGDRDICARRLREGKEFFSFFNHSKQRSTKKKSLLAKVIKDGGPGFCQFAITDACNAVCGFCNFSANMSDGRARTFVDTDYAQASIEVLAENGIEYLAFVGGEPTLHKNLPELISFAKRLDIHPIICTNGWLMTSENVDTYARAGLESAIISIDAPDEELHENNRGLPGVCDRITKANALLKGHGITSTASVTISRLTEDFGLLPEFLKKLGFERVTFSYPLKFLPSGFKGYSESELIEYTADELTERFDEIINLKNKIRVMNPAASLRDIQCFVNGRPQRFGCLAGYKYFYLDWKLQLFRCHAWDKPMCHVFDFGPDKLIRDNCQACMIDCYRDASVMHHVGISIHDAHISLKSGRYKTAVRQLFNKSTVESVKSIMEDINRIRQPK